MRVPAILVILIAAALTGARAEARPDSAEAWVSLRVAPALSRELASHPRFHDETIRIVVFTDDRPAPQSNAFAMALRDRLEKAVFDTPGIRMAAPADALASIDCTLDDVHYFIGLQITAVEDGEHRIDLRMLDAEDRSWVTGFEPSWQGSLTSRQAEALAKPQADPYFRGDRNAPFIESEVDMMAARLAHDLACASMRQMAGEYVVLFGPAGDDPDAGPGPTELIGNNLAAVAALQVTDDPARANAVLRSKAHPVRPGLEQYWATLTPIDAGSELPTLSVSAYLETTVVEEERTAVLRRSQSVLAPATLVAAAGSDCPTSNARCAALQVQSRQDAVVFFLNHQKTHGLVRLAGPDCRSRPRAHVLRANESLRQPLPISSVMPDAASITTAWEESPGADTYVAIAISNSKAARLVARHLQQLPQRCTAAVRFGLSGDALDTWMQELASLASRWPGDIDWQAVQVRNVY